MAMLPDTATEPLASVAYIDKAGHSSKEGLVSSWGREEGRERRGRERGEVCGHGSGTGVNGVGCVTYKG